MMGTPFTAFLDPSDLSAYDATKPPASQSSAVPKTFLDAMEVREKVFVQEQGIPPENEFDTDDPRCCHWVIYASINTVVSAGEIDSFGKITKPQESKTRTTPIGTIRLVPFPHFPHPEPGSKFVFSPEVMAAGPPSYIVDRKTTFHDGVEPYLKLGRLAVIKEFRGSGMAKVLVNAAMTWARENPTFFNPSVAEVGMENLGAESIEDVPVWKGLICVHAQEQVEKTWAKWGYKVDQGMGKWDEEGIMHVGMFQRLELNE